MVFRSNTLLSLLQKEKIHIFLLGADFWTLDIWTFQDIADSLSHFQKHEIKLIGMCFLFHLTLYFHGIVKQFVQCQLQGFNKVQILTNKMLELELVLLRNVYLYIKTCFYYNYHPFCRNISASEVVFLYTMTLPFHLYSEEHSLISFQIRHHVNL